MTFSLIIAAIFSAFIYVPRPFIKYKFTPLVPHIGDSSFPSDHATESMSIALGFYSYNKILSAIIIFFSIVLCLAKVYAGHHSVLDILCSYIMVLILKFVYIKLFQNNVEKFYYKLENILFVHR